MRKIIIDEHLNDFVNSFYKDLFLNSSTGIRKPFQKLGNLIPKYSSDGVATIALSILISDFDKIVMSTPLEIKNLISSFELDFPGLFYDMSSKKRDKKTAFGKDVSKAFMYKDFRDKVAYKIVDYLKLYACPYCNAQLTVVVDSIKGKRKARLQFDHFYSKDKFPYLSISFFNLIPCCSNCNLSKSNIPFDIDSHFNLYADCIPNFPFRFELDDMGFAKFLLSKKVEDLKIVIKPGSDSNPTFISDHNKVFDIEGVYNTQKDIVEELIYKASAYSKAKVDELKQFKALFPDNEIFKRVLLGNYYKQDDIHKRPLSKFIQDIAKQLKLM